MVDGLESKMCARCDGPWPRTGGEAAFLILRHGRYYRHVCRRDRRRRRVEPEKLFMKK